MQFSIEDEQRLIMELEAISKQSGYSLPSSKTSSAAPHQVNRASLICMLTSHIIIFITRSSCQEARYVCRQAACEGCQNSILSLVGLARCK